MATDPDREDINSIFDSIIPGKLGKWPPFSDCISDNANISENIFANNKTIIASVIQKRAAGLDIGQSIEAAQAEDHLGFMRLYRQLCDAYYSSPSVVALVAEISDAGPREASPHFDPALLKTVIATQAGKRRL